MFRVVRNRAWRPPAVPLWVLPLVLLVAVWLVGAVRTIHEEAAAPAGVSARTTVVNASAPVPVR